MPDPNMATAGSPAPPHDPAVPVRLVQAGAGRWGRILATELARVPGTRLIAIASRQEDAGTLLAPGGARVTPWSALFGAATAAGSPADPAARARPDGVIVATPAATHATIALAAIALGIPVFVEKPLALDAETAAGIALVARARGVPVLVDHIDLANPAWQAVNADAGPASRAAPDRLAIDIGGHGPFRPDCDPLWDWGPHAVALAVARLGPELALEHVTCTDGPTPGVAGAPPGRVYRAELSGAAGTAVLSFGNGLPEKTRRVEIRRPGDSLHVYDDRAPVKASRHAGPDAPATPLAHPDTPPVVVALQRFAEVCRVHRVGRATGDDLDLAVPVVQLLGAIAARCRSVATP